MAAEPQPPQTDARKARQNFDDGNFRDAYQTYRHLSLTPGSAGAESGEHLSMAVSCLQQLQRLGEIDKLLQEFVAIDNTDWRRLWKAATVLDSVPHFGVIVAGEFVRGNARGGGSYVEVEARDRVQSLMWMNAARQKIPGDADGKIKADFFHEFAAQLLDQSEGAWKLQVLTDLETLPDYPEGTGRRFGRFGGYRSQNKTPVDADGNPIFYAIPESFEAAKSDGERWRWCLNQVVAADATRQDAVKLEYANFLLSQFGVGTLRDAGIFLPEAKDSLTKEEGIWSLTGLSDDETIAQLATGPKRFKLPADANFIKLFREVADGKSEGTAGAALNSLVQIYLNRQQYPKATGVLKESLKRFPKDADGRAAQLKQIEGNWGDFEPRQNVAAGKPAQVDYRFRNGTSVEFTAFRLKVPELIADIQAYLESRPAQVEWERIQIEQIGMQIVNEGKSKYLGEKVASWSLKLEPREKHFDKRITVTTPLQKAGAYLVSAKMADGNISRIVMWVEDTAIVKKRVASGSLYYVADAVTGEPVADAQIDFFGWKQQREMGRGRGEFQVVTSKFAKKTNASGLATVDPALMLPEYQWIAVARSAAGRYAYLGFSHVWFNSFRDIRDVSSSAYIITDRPVYRPEQKVQYKVWVRRADYGKDNRGLYADKPFTVKLIDPQGNEVFKKNLTTDEFGAIQAEHLLPKNAKLGQYQIEVSNGKDISQFLGFRVEEYKKPEFEVTIESPDTPVQLGEKVSAKVQAKYYYGAPVTQGTVKVKVERSAKVSKWFPLDPWDWLYGNGYWWFAPNATWHPGFHRWGCIIPPIGFNVDPPELVIDQEVQIGPDGTATIEIDTSLAKELHGDEDHEYTITAEVTDASRRTIVGSGKVLVSREPYKVTVWTNRGYYNVGDSIQADLKARSLDGKGIKGFGKLELLKLSYPEGKLVETSVQVWDLETDAEGSATQTIKASEAGQYRLSYKMQTAADAPVIEGGHLFVIRGEGFDGSQFRFGDLELVAEKKTYAPGETVRLMLNTNRTGATVLLFVRSVNGVAAKEPQILKLSGKSEIVEIPVEAKDMPNFYVEALTISHGEIFNLSRELMVPPEKRVLNVEVLPSNEKYLPGQEAEIQLKVTDAQGNPFAGSLVVSVYDRAVEYISGGSNIEEIKSFFWGWKRLHHINKEDNLTHWSTLLRKTGEVIMENLGVFGDQVADMGEIAVMDAAPSVGGGMGGGMGGGGFGRHMRGAPQMMEKSLNYAAPGAPMPTAAPMAAADAAGGDAPVQPMIRSEFADTAFWKADLTSDSNGLAKVTFKMPENLSSWKIRTWGMGADTVVGEGTADVVTAKNIIVRLQAPRFFVERDEVVLSAVVHNYLATEKEVTVQLDLEGETLSLITDASALTGNKEPSVRVTVPAGGETRVDWTVKATQAGIATVTMKALTNEESDAMQMKFPVKVHGISKTESFAGVIRPDQNSGKVEFAVPSERIAEQTRLEVRYSPTVAGAMVDALPYLVDYPYGCTEQTLNRFVPTVITHHLLKTMGVNLKEIQEKRTNLNAQQLGDAAERAKQWKRFDRNPVFDDAEVQLMVETGIRDLASMQNSDGGWGWFSGYKERSWPHTTAVIVHGFQQAAKSDVAIPQDVLSKGVQWLARAQEAEVALLQEGERHAKDPKRTGKYRSQASDIDALVFQVLVESGVKNEEMQRFLYRDRVKLSLYSQALIGLAFHELGAFEQRDMVIRNIDQFVKIDEENQTAFIDLPNNNDWWFWYGSRTESNAFYLKLLTKVNAKSTKASQLAKYLINNRRNGTYWNNTRDTAYAIEALAEFAIASGESRPHFAVEVWLDGELKKSVKITPNDLFTFDNAFVVEGEALAAGKHTLELKRKPLSEEKSAVGPLYYNAYLTNFTKEDNITATGLEIRVGRKFFKLVEDKSATSTVAGSRGQAIDQKVKKYTRHELARLEDVVSGDLVEIELEIDSKNDYEYVIFEDAKAAGCEPVDLQSGYTEGGLGAYVEFRDDRVVFFLRELKRGKHSVKYRVRAEIPGKFSALPTIAEGMYAPELKANSDEFKLKIQDK
ncbi:alpha-2-macroglobulin family protein [Planctomicrobium sp. SH527]|uniref:alpha-2-macroglobulin family protein n=1 Tax=Planctomicrobium sp. SH527 TaxID=3448123 RepID=UPI003F5B5076